MAFSSERGFKRKLLIFVTTLKKVRNIYDWCSFFIQSISTSSLSVFDRIFLYHLKDIVALSSKMSKDICSVIFFCKVVEKTVFENCSIIQPKKLLDLKVQSEHFWLCSDIRVVLLFRFSKKTEYLCLG